MPVNPELITKLREVYPETDYNISTEEDNEGNIHVTISKVEHPFVPSEDLEAYITKYMEDIVDDHFKIWRDRYYRKSLEDIIFDINVNYDKSCEIENVEIQLERELTDDEKTYVYECFIHRVKTDFYQ